jgi:uncharacterized protein
MKYFWTLLLVALCMPLYLLAESAGEEALFESLAAYRYGQDRTPLLEINHMVNATHGNPTARHAIENRLLAVIGNETATVDGKAFACEMLSRIGSPLAAFPVAKLLGDPVLSTHALVALERIPRGEPNRALREAIPDLEGDQRVGVITAMGNRGASISVETLAAQLNMPEYADAAAAALGAIGGNDALQTLILARANSAYMKAIDLALLQCANNITTEQTASIYEYLSREGSTEMIRVAGFNGQIQYCDDAAPLLREALLPENRRHIQATLAALGNPETAAVVATGLATVAPELAPETRDTIVTALAARTDTVAKTLYAQLEPAADKQLEGATILQNDPIFPNGYGVVAYLNCGAAQSAPENTTPAINLVKGQPFTFPEVEGAVGTVAFDAEKVVYEISGLNPKSEYVLGFTWWDADDSGRMQSVGLSKDGATWDTVLPAVHPAAYNKDKSTWARVLLPLIDPYSANETLQVAFVNEGGPNAVVNELFLLERTAPVKAKRVLIVTGDDYAGHVWRDTAPVLAALLREDDRLEVSINECPAIYGSPLLSHYDATVLHFKNYDERLPISDMCLEGLAAYVANGKGLVIAHFGCGAFQEQKGFVNVAGRIWNPAFRAHDPHGTFGVRITNPDHPITQGLAAFETTDELYTCLDGDTPITVLCDAVSVVDKKTYPMAFIVEETGGRVFHSVLGHDPVAFEAAGVRDLYRRATLWAAGL